MPFVYTASTLTGKKVQSNEFRTRDITGLTRGQLEDICLLGLPTQVQPAYDNYAHALPAFLHATAVQKKVSVSAGYFKSNLDPSLIIPISLPPLVFTPDEPLRSENERDQFMGEIGHNVRVHRFRNQDIFTIDMPTAPVVMGLPLEKLDFNTPSPDDSTNLMGMMSLLTTLKIITLFLATHTYPAYQTPEAPNQYTADAQYALHKQYISSTDKVRVGLLREEYKKRRIPVAELDKALDEVEMQDDWAEAIHVSGEDAVLVAKPAPLRPTINHGRPSETPAFPGFVLPYFHKMVDPSSRTIISVMRRYFIRAMGTSAEDLRLKWAQWLKGLRRWHDTECGRAVAHILFSMQTAIEAQARIFLYIVNGSYRGNSILGYRLMLAMGQSVLLADDVKEVRRLAGTLDRHTEALEEICNMMSRTKLEDSDDVEMLEPDRMTTARALHREINRREAVVGTDLDNLHKYIGKLTFSEPFWPMTVEYIVKALRTLVELEQVDDEWPMYIVPEMVYDGTLVFETLSAFGPMAPSFLDQSGTEFPIPKGLEAPDPSSIRDPNNNNRRPLDSILVSGKSLRTACTDWENVVKKRRIRQNVSERASGYRTIKFRERARDMIWATMRQMSWTDGDNAKGKKRARDEDDMDDGERTVKRSTTKPAEKVLDF